MVNISSDKEREFKKMLTGEEYKQLMMQKRENVFTEKVQKNHYFDTCDFNLNQNGHTLRLREKDNTYTLTLKTKISTNTEYRYSNEESSIIPSEIAELLINENMPVVDLLKKCYGRVIDRMFSSENIIYMGHLVTLRTSFTPDSIECKIELDKNIYLNCCDYELECELKYSIGFEKLSKWLAKNGISNICDKYGKYSRFVRMLKKRQISC